ncbi:CRISPR-associated protein Cas4 [Pseudothermotoga thermarum]|uniref:CRISPR-associated exonuclease Cas4 n=1 Tax=Pseudothermotoga thermarum DSM 5069 TaxID=688269 RepID=F7YVR9_9THEM|nr:CRISPR-associated protein Cas4 [Pseudothermotoga thermarum]AEH51737.1 CRISPR-associated exonuclease, Cas4 family [Pseudothermotoga thermarum DSM 5069]
MVTGSSLLSYTVCKRQAWLMQRNVEPDQANEYLVIGRLIHSESYKDKAIREITLPGMKIDLVWESGGLTIVGEIKKSSRYLKGAKLQLLFYLSELRKRGIKAVGKILIPKEKKQINVELTEENLKELYTAIEELEELSKIEKIPPKKRTSFCTKCGFEEFCWS